MSKTGTTRQRKTVFELIEDARKVGDISRFITLTKRWLKTYKTVVNKQQANNQTFQSNLKQLTEEERQERGEYGSSR